MRKMQKYEKQVQERWMEVDEIRKFCGRARILLLCLMKKSRFITRA